MTNKEINTANIWRRILAMIIDLIFICCIAIISIVVTSGIPNEFLSQNQKNKINLMIVSILFLILLLIKDFRKGVSFGRWVVGISVRNNKEPYLEASKFKMLTRNLFLVFWPWEILLLIINPNNKRIGDYLAKTVVIKDVLAPLKKRLLTLVMAIFLAIILWYVTALISLYVYLIIFKTS